MILLEKLSLVMMSVGFIVLISFLYVFPLQEVSLNSLNNYPDDLVFVRAKIESQEVKFNRTYFEVSSICSDEFIFEDIIDRDLEGREFEFKGRYKEFDGKFHVETFKNG